MKVEKPQPLSRESQQRSQIRKSQETLKSEADDSRQTYTAMIFNDRQRQFHPQPQPPKPKRKNISFRKDMNGEMEQLLKINSLSRMISNKQIRNSVTIFQNVKLNNSIDHRGKKYMQRPASAFTKTNKDREIIDFESILKENACRLNRDLSLLGKNCFEEANVKICERQNELQADFQDFSPKVSDSPENYGYIAKSRLYSGKEQKKSHHHPNQQKNTHKKVLKYDTAINFQSLYKNLLINSKAVNKRASPSQKLSTHQIHKKHMHSFHSSFKNKQNTNFSSTSSALVLTKNERNSVCHLTIKDRKDPFESFHKYNSKIPLTTQIIKSIKKGKSKISKILSMSKSQVVEPQLLIQNIDIAKNTRQNMENPSGTFITSQSIIAKYLTKQSPIAIPHSLSKPQQNCQLVLQCKKITYF